jgi:alkylated DNA repair dioxygenase AlkB
VLTNAYNDPKSKISAHSDDEVELLKGTPILTAIFGKTAGKFILRSKRTNPATTVTFHTKHGDVLVMRGAKFQSEWTHEVPACGKRKWEETLGDQGIQGRLSITVRSC